MSNATVLGRSIPGRGKNKSKGPEVLTHRPVAQRTVNQAGPQRLLHWLGLPLFVGWEAIGTF